MSAVQWRRLDLPYEVWEAGRGLVAARVFGADADLPGACVWRRGLLVMSTSRSSVEEAKAAVAGWCLALGLPGQGMVIENLITLCAPCHVYAEDFINGDLDELATSERGPGGYAPSKLYALIGSSYEAAVRASEVAS